MTKKIKLIISSKQSDISDVQKQTFSKLHDAVDAAEEYFRSTICNGNCRTNDIQIVIGEGTYSLDKPVVISNLSGLTICAEKGTEPRLTGLSTLKNFEVVDDTSLPVSSQAKGKLVKISIQRGLIPAAFYVNSRKCNMAMWPKHNTWEKWPTCSPGKNRFELIIPKEMQKRHTCQQDIFLNILSTPYTHWVNYISNVTNIDNDLVTIATPTTPVSFLSPADIIPFRIENALETLTEPGEWCVDREAGFLYYWPMQNDAIETARFEISKLSTLIDFQGSKDNLVKNVKIYGLTFTDTSDGAAVRLSGTKNCTISNCTFDNLGGEAINATGITHGLQISNCNISNCSAGGITLKAPACSKENISSSNIIKNNTISYCGKNKWQSSGIKLTCSSHNIVKENKLHHLPYAAIAIGGTRFMMVLTESIPNWSAQSVSYEQIKKEKLNIETFKKYVAGHNIIENNQIEDVMMQLDDGGAIYSHASHHNVFRGNVVKRTHRGKSHGLYFDDDEMYSTMENNTVIDCPQQYGGSSIHVHDNARNTVQNNTVTGSYCPFTFQSSYGGHHVSNNTFVLHPDCRLPIFPGQNAGRYEKIKWDAGVNYFDNNIYWSEDDGVTAEKILHYMQKNGSDKNSKVKRNE